MKRRYISFLLLLIATVWVSSGFVLAKSYPMYKEPAGMTGYWVATTSITRAGTKIPVVRAFSIDYKFLRELKRTPGTQYLEISEYVEMFEWVNYIKGKSLTFATGEDFSQEYKVVSRPTANTANIKMYCGETNRIVSWKATRFDTIEEAEAFIAKNCKAVIAKEVKEDEARYISDLPSFYSETSIPSGRFFNDQYKRIFIDIENNTIEVGNSVADTYTMYRFTVEHTPPRGLSGFDLAEKLVFTTPGDNKTCYVLTIGSSGEITSAQVISNGEIRWHTESTFRASEY